MERKKMATIFKIVNLWLCQMMYLIMCQIMCQMMCQQWCNWANVDVVCIGLFVAFIHGIYMNSINNIHIKTCKGSTEKFVITILTWVGWGIKWNRILTLWLIFTACPHFTKIFSCKDSLIYRVNVLGLLCNVLTVRFLTVLTWVGWGTTWKRRQVVSASQAFE